MQQKKGLHDAFATEREKRKQHLKSDESIFRNSESLNGVFIMSPDAILHFNEKIDMGLTFNHFGDLLTEEDTFTDIGKFNWVFVYPVFL